VASLCGLALFIPFSIAGANVSIMLGFLGSLIGMFFSARLRARYWRIKDDPLFLATILLVVLALPSVLISEDLRRALRDYKSYWLLLVYFLVAYNLHPDRLRKVVFWTLFSSMSVSCLVTFIQYRGGLDLLFVHIGPETYRPSSTLYTMTFSGILYQIITVNFAVLLKERRLTRTAVTMALGTMLHVTSLILTLTRGAWLALVAGVGAVAVFLKRKRTIFSGVAVVAVLAGVVLLTPSLRHRVATRVNYVSDIAIFNVTTRFVLWDIAWELFRENPVMGVGMGDYTLEADEMLRDRRVTTTVDSHNIYLHLLATRGLVGFLPFVFWWFMLFKMLARAHSRLGSDRVFDKHFIVGAAAAAVAVLTGALTENNVDDSEVFTAFLFLIGFARSIDVFRDETGPPV
jgi:O-antigen ligase